MRQHIGGPDFNTIFIELFDDQRLIDQVFDFRPILNYERLDLGRYYGINLNNISLLAATYKNDFGCQNIGRWIGHKIGQKIWIGRVLTVYIDNRQRDQQRHGTGATGA